MVRLWKMVSESSLTELTKPKKIHTYCILTVYLPYTYCIHTHHILTHSLHRAVSLAATRASIVSNIDGGLNDLLP
jgi:hypothetical protein